jgi:hypothetical protein
MKKIVSILCVLSVLTVTSCGGRQGNPVMPMQYGDDRKSCKALESEIAFIESEIQRLFPKTDKTAQNVALGVTGYFLIVPLFFMDFKNGELKEYEAYRQRYNHLSIIAIDKNCGLNTSHMPSVEEMRKAQEESKARTTIQVQEQQK